MSYETEEKVKKAVALKHEGTAAPIVAAKGKGHTAETIIELAKEHNIPLRKDPDLVEMLSKVELNQEIPENLYKAVAEIFVFLYNVTRDGEKSRKEKDQLIPTSS
jgi:flagellar biosynthesis protein